jgi:hypothetical protein
VCVLVKGPDDIPDEASAFALLGHESERAGRAKKLTQVPSHEGCTEPRVEAIWKLLNVKLHEEVKVSLLGRPDIEGTGWGNARPGWSSERIGLSRRRHGYTLDPIPYRYVLENLKERSRLAVGRNQKAATRSHHLLQVSADMTVSLSAVR